MECRRLPGPIPNLSDKLGDHLSDKTLKMIEFSGYLSQEPRFGFLQRFPRDVAPYVLFHDVTRCIGHNGAATSTTILSLPSPSKPVAGEQMEEVGAVLKNDSSTTTSLIEDFPKTTASQDILGDTATS
ncbi:hypothetical protein AVEN_60505-1 [Araneus ventricosus]|uniref:Uncharacterized protein n=1 Tax=Araneus ventricosus TaxID=182803 RepID=A0A4Y2GAN7_ARAVE|nr:hypothetical protein AVEN_60505-1 [Araneus ventricosus]